MKFFYLILLGIVIITTSCSEGEAKSKGCHPICEDYQVCVEDKCKLKAERCDSNGDCASNESCNSEHKCIEQINPCAGVTCSEEGTCVVLDNEAKCNCNIGFKESGLECVADECNGVTCDNHGTCEVINNNAICNCYDGYHSDGTNCIINDKPCDSVTCSNHGTCSDTTGVAICTCEAGYYADGSNCLKEGSPCDNVNCGNGTCNDSTGNAVCDCETGYHSEGLKCIQDSNPCDSVSCGNGVCVTDTENNPTCNCNDGYVLQGLTCVKITSPCDNQNCSNKGLCENLNGLAKCNCDDGYEDEGLECVKVSVVDWCKVVGPTSINATVGDEAVSVFAQIFSQGLTEEAGSNTAISGSLGYTSQDILYPIDNAQFTWVDANFNESCNDCGFNDEYSAALPATSAGNLKYIFRFTINSGASWSYCDVNSKIEGEGFTPGLANISEANDPCNEVSCSGHGVCVVDNNAATCNCDAGYHANGNECEIDEVAQVEWCNVQSPNNFTALVGSDDATKLIFGQVFIPNVTSSDTAVSTVKAELGYSTADLTSPINPGLLEWKAAEFNKKANANHEYKVSVTFDLKGVYNYIYRFSADNGTTWKYCHIPGLINDGDTIDSGVATINGLCDNVTCSDHGACSVVDGRAACECEAGYKLSDDKLNCIEMPKVDWCKIQYPKSINNEVSNSPVNVYGRVYVSGITEQSTEQAQIRGQFGYVASETLAYPIDDTIFTWIDASYHESCQNCGDNDEYMAEFPINTAGNYRYLYRFSVDNGQNWAYCDKTSIVSNETFNPGVANIFESGDPCDGVTCDGHGVCNVEFNQALCTCDPGYHLTPTQVNCEVDLAPTIEWCSLMSPVEINLFSDEVKTISVLSQVYIPTITVLATGGENVIAQQGHKVGEITNLLDQEISWAEASFSERKYGANHEYKYDWVYNKTFSEDTILEYIYRFSMDSGQTWTYCDKNGKLASDATEVDGGKLIITKRAAPEVAWCNVQSPQQINALVGDSKVVYGQVFIDGVTTEVNENQMITSQFAITGAAVNSYNDLSTLTWNNASFNTKVNNNHEYMINQDFTSDGSFSYFYRFSTDAGNTWKYCDIDGVVLSGDNTFSPGIANIVAPINPCDGELCSNHGTCSVVNELAECSCEQGYTLSQDKLSCIIESGPEVAWCVVQYPKELDATVGDSISFYGRVHVSGLTESDGNEASIKAQFGHKSVTEFPLNGLAESEMASYQWDDQVVFNSRYGNNYEYKADVTFDSASVGKHLYFYRFSVNNGNTWKYCDVVDAEGELYHPGKASVNEAVDACTGITCGGHGSCVLNSGTASCNCEDGYVADGLVCNLDLPPSPCDNIWCSFKGGCELDQNNNPSCNCTDVQYKTSADGLDCIHVNHTYHTIDIYNSMDTWHTQYTDMGNGYTNNDSPIKTFVTWDTEKIYIAMTGKNLTLDANASFEIYFDNYKGSEVNSGVEYAYDHDNGVNGRVLPSAMKADKLLTIGVNGAKLFAYNTPETGDPYWNSEGMPLATIVYTGEVTKLSIPITALELEANNSLSIAMYLTDKTSDYVYATWPTNNTKGEDNIAGSENDTLYQLTIIENQKPNQQ